MTIAIPCANVKAACARNTMTSTIPSARLATAGGWPRGFQAMKTSMAANEQDRTEAAEEITDNLPKPS